MGGAQAASVGMRDRFITIQRVADSVGASGFPVETWATLVDHMPASRMDLKGREALRSGQVSASVDTQWEINYRLDMDPELVDVPKARRLVHNGRVHDIVSANVVGRREGIALTTIASTVVA